MSKKVDTWMPLIIDKYLGDTNHLTTEQHGAYLLLLMTMWKKGGELPYDERQLAATTRLTPQRWRASREVILAFFSVEDGKLIQKRLAHEFSIANRIADKKSEAGSKGAQKRWHGDSNANGRANGKANGSEHGKSNGIAIENGWQKPWQTDAPIPIQADLKDIGRAESVPTQQGARASESEGNSRGTSAAELSPAVRMRLALTRGGLNPTTLHASDVRVIALVEMGVTEAEIEAIAREGTAKGKGLGWIVATAKGRREDAAALRLSPAVPEPDPMAWSKTRGGVINRANALGIGPWNEVDAFNRQGPTWQQYRQRVINADAAQRQGAPA